MLTANAGRRTTPNAGAGRFPGYPSGAAQTPVPNAFFSELLPRLAARPVDLAVATYAFFALGRRRGFPRYVTGADLRADEPLRAAVAAALHGGAWDAEAIDAALSAALDALTRDGALLELRLAGDTAYFLPTPADRRSMERVRTSLPVPARAASTQPAERGPATSAADVIAWYEASIGTVPPMLIDELREAEATYPREWIEEAFREAATLNHRSWRYVRRILERWAEEGRDEHEETGRDPREAQRERYWRGLPR